MRRSIVFIVDSQFDATVYRDKAYQYVKEFYKGLSDEDYFGFISLDQNASLNDIMLECGAKNKHIKQKVLEQASQREFDIVTHFGIQKKSMKHRF